jgi:membrane-bound lytic murein transglycosylase D
VVVYLPVRATHGAAAGTGTSRGHVGASVLPLQRTSASRAEEARPRASARSSKAPAVAGKAASRGGKVPASAKAEVRKVPRASSKDVVREKRGGTPSKKKR